MKYTTLYTLILGLFSIGWTDCPEDFMERMQRPGHSEIQLSKVTISGRVLDESGFPLAGATIQEKETANGIIRKSKFPWFPERSVQFSGKRTKRSVQKKGCTQHL